MNHFRGGVKRNTSIKHLSQSLSSDHCSKRANVICDEILSCSLVVVVVVVGVVEVGLMDTIRWNGENEEDVRSAAACLRAGGLVAFPTETVFGLGGDATRDLSVAAIFHAKGRPSDNPLIVHVASSRALLELGFVKQPWPRDAARLMETFWPGPLTLVLPLQPGGPISRRVTAGLDSVAVRVPKHPVALALLAAAAIPIAAPSANSSGRPSPTRSHHVWSDLHGKIDGILGAPVASVSVGVESTILDLTSDEPTILRPGGVSREALEKVLGSNIRSWTPSHVTTGVPKAPGMKYRHYAPSASVRLVANEDLEREVRREVGSGSRVGVLATEIDINRLRSKLEFETAGHVVLVPCGKSERSMETVAQDLFDALRSFDELADPVDVVIAQEFSDAGIGAAVMNRLRKAAGKEGDTNPEM
uniref:Threonylcarbamoyl-AMP synthase n=1 Tax=Compsopogon caeruleus TaxID=31354 RepID=A0A7S1XFB4_9RHOD|mmetsp:Transcript_31/g.45  ORF Transcript_31/g.45 Transcript_31/m.45 type:complete len:417 (+) Transcript_31:794-2044(+)